MNGRHSTLASEYSAADLRAIAQRHDNGIIVRRWAACWIDFLLVLILLTMEWLLLTPVPKESVAAPFLLTLLASVLAYYFIFEGLWGATPGKRLLRIRVVAPRDGMNWWIRIAIRTALRLIEVNPLFLGGLPAGICAVITPGYRRVGDLLAGTHVVETDMLNLQHDPWARVGDDDAPRGPDASS